MRLSRDGPHNISLDAASAALDMSDDEDKSVRLDIIVEAVGRSNQGWRFDTKGLSSPNVQWNGERITHSFPVHRNYKPLSAPPAPQWR